MLFTIFPIMFLQGVPLTNIAYISYTIRSEGSAHSYFVSLCLQTNTKLRQKRNSIYVYKTSIHVLAISTLETSRTKSFTTCQTAQGDFLSVDMLSPEQPPHPALLTQSAVESVK